jgi:hypothetical protein
VQQVKTSQLSDAGKTIEQTLFTARIFNGFWDRWKAHGVHDTAITEVLTQVKNLEQWESTWERHALSNQSLADTFKHKRQIKEAEYYYRLSALYYNLIQWIYPERCVEKSKWFKACVSMFQEADTVSPNITEYEDLLIDGYKCHGRIRIPDNSVGCIIIMNPLDSSKEELFTYEMDFVQGNFAVISFDGPGQGETYTLEGLKGTNGRWEKFTDRVIEYAAERFPDLPIHLFGTSSGASWTLYGCRHPKVASGVAISPAIAKDDIQLPDYFLHRMRSVWEENESSMPEFKPIPEAKPVYLIHGLKDVMVSTEDIQKLYDLLPDGKQYKEYIDEGHCCNYKLGEIRRLAMNWYINVEGVVGT